MVINKISVHSNFNKIHQLSSGKMSNSLSFGSVQCKDDNIQTRIAHSVKYAPITSVQEADIEANNILDEFSLFDIKYLQYLIKTDRNVYYAKKKLLNQVELPLQKINAFILSQRTNGEVFSHWGDVGEHMYQHIVNGKPVPAYMENIARLHDEKIAFFNCEDFGGIFIKQDPEINLKEIDEIKKNGNCWENWSVLNQKMEELQELRSGRRIVL